MKFRLDDSIYRPFMERMTELSQTLTSIAQKAGTGNPRFEAAWQRLHRVLARDKFSEYRVRDRFDLRALSIALGEKRSLRKSIRVTPDLLEAIDEITPKPSYLFVDALYQYYLRDLDCLDSPKEVGQWLRNKRELLGTANVHDESILGGNGPKILAIEAIKRSAEFDSEVERFGLQNYAHGDFIKRAKHIYYVEQLKSIPLNQPHQLLEEVCRPDVYESRYDESALLGHKVLEILIRRAPAQGIDKSWQECVLAIGGDPRVPRGHPRFVKWWTQIPQDLIKKVHAWLSKLDLKLFLDALEDYSNTFGDADMQRMFPTRKQFLEGLHDKGAIVHTKLYLSRKADYFIKKSYRPEHVPDYSIVNNGDISVIYAELTHGHMVEGSHNCQIWFYERLHSSAPVLSLGSERRSYRSLTKGMDEEMSIYDCNAVDHFPHNPSRFGWQRRSVQVLQAMGVDISASDVLSSENYKQYKRFYGVD